MNLIHRGQTLVLLSLTVLLIALMVLMTLSLGAKVRDRMDLQTVADAAAYSNAIATARTMNTMAVMNRAMIAHTVSTIGTVSLISYASLYLSDAEQALTIFKQQLLILVAGVIFWLLAFLADAPWVKPVDWAHFIACLESVALVLASIGFLSAHISNIKGRLNNDVTVYNAETLPRFKASTSLYTSATAMFDTKLRTQLGTNTGSFADTYLTQAKVATATPYNSPASVLNSAELDRATIPNTDHSGAQPYQAANIAMGTRGHKFVPQRHPDMGDWSLQLSFPNAFPNGVLVTDDSTGRGYINTNVTPNPSSAAGGYGHPGPAGGNGIWAHDDANTVRTILIGSIFGIIVTANKSNYVTCRWFGPAAVAWGLIGQSAGNCNVGATQHACIGHVGPHAFPGQTFPAFYDFNPTSLFEKDDLYGQPRNVSMVSKAPPTTAAGALPTDPWNVTTGFTPGMSGTGWNAHFDMNGEPQVSTNTTKQLALGAGVTYYSRAGHNDEPPNMFAPYWHATLGRLTIDRPQVGNVKRAAYDAEVMTMLNNTLQPEAAIAYQQLTAAGYLGLE